MVRLIGSITNRVLRQKCVSTINLTKGDQFSRSLTMSALMGDATDTMPRRHRMEPPSQSSLSTPRVSESVLSAVTIEPLPDIAGAKSGKTYTKPMGYNQVVNKRPNVSDWFQPGDSAPDFPRAQLQYVKELGSGWFESVVEGEASKMSPQKRKIKVVVQILREDLTSMERAYLLHTAKMFRDLAHENVLKIVGKCVDKEPYLLLYEQCAQGDYLKSYLIARRGISDDLVHSGAVLKMYCDVADGLGALHSRGFVHNDLATRNCLVSTNGTVKIGDYGTGFSVFKNEYVTIGDIAVSIRWISPDTGQLLTKEVTQVDNVWTLGVVIWEILEFGKMPYTELSDDAVINMELKNRSTYLQPPSSPLLRRERFFGQFRRVHTSSTVPPEEKEKEKESGSEDGPAGDPRRSAEEIDTYIFNRDKKLWDEIKADRIKGESREEKMLEAIKEDRKSADDRLFQFLCLSFTVVVGGVIILCRTTIKVIHDEKMAFSSSATPTPLRSRAPDPDILGAKIVKRIYGAKRPFSLKTVLDRVMLVCQRFDKINADKLTLDSHFMYDLGLDRLDHVEVMLYIEKEFGLEIPDSDAEQLMTPRHIIQYICG